MADLKTLNKDTLKVGDTVYVRKKFCIGWSHFRYDEFSQETIVRITPKRTKFVTDKNEYDKYVTFYAPSDELSYQNEIVYNVRRLNDVIYKLAMSRKENAFSNLSDEQLLAMHCSITNIESILLASNQNRKDNSQNK